MSRLPFIAELHDVGKLIDVECRRLSGQMSKRQKVHDIDLASLGVSPPSAPSWWATFSDELTPEQSFDGLKCDASVEQKALVLLTKIADGTSASVSRIEVKGPTSRGEGVRLLWRPDFFEQERRKGLHWTHVRDTNDLKEMIQFFDECASPYHLFSRFHDSLRLTPEDKSPPSNFIPLRVHLELSGKIFRVMNQYVSLDRGDPNSPQLVYDQQPISTLRQAVGGALGAPHEAMCGKWIFRIVKCSVCLSQSMVRLQDLNLLERRRRLIDEIVDGQSILGDFERQPYAVLFHTDDFLCLFLPREKYLSLEDVLRPLWEKGFWIKCEELEAELNLLTSSGERTRKKLQQKHPGDPMCGGRHLRLRHIAVWPQLDPYIDPPLCDQCQQRGGREYVKDKVREWLCLSCREIRELGQPASVYAQWEEEGVPSAWLKMSLDQKLLISYLRRLFEAYVDTESGIDQLNASEKQVLKDGFRPLAAQMEFVREYAEFLEEFKGALENLMGSNGSPLLKPGESLLFPIPGYLELTILRLDSSETLGAALDAFVQFLSARFPECLEDCPIRLSVSMANPKYPYQEHWRFFSEPQQPAITFCIQQPGVRQVNLTVSQYTALRDKLAGDRLSHFLHRLTAIEAQAGELTALVQALEQRRRFPQIHELMMFHGLGLRQILDFYRLVGFNTQHEETLRA